MYRYYKISQNRTIFWNAIESKLASQSDGDFFTLECFPAEIYIYDPYSDRSFLKFKSLYAIWFEYTPSV